MQAPDFESIYKEYFSGVYKYSLSICRSETIAEEITQETFFKAMRHIDHFNGSCKLYVWLCQIAKNTYFTYCQKNKRLMPEIDNEYPDKSFDLEKRCMDKETVRQLHFLLHGLKEPYKEVFSLRVFGELPYSQIGEIFGKTDSWARLIFYRAKKQIQEEMK